MMWWQDIMFSQVLINQIQPKVLVDQLTKMNCKVLNRGWDHGSLQLKEGWTTHIEAFEFEEK